MSQRAAFLRFVDACHRARIPYLWGGKSLRGLDCSGLVTLGLWLVSGQDFRAMHNTQRMWNEWEPISSAATRPGDLALYGRTPEKVEHVMVLLEGGAVVGASGGGRTTTSLEEAARIGACVKRYRSPLYRKDLLGYRRLPLPLDGA